MRNQILRSYFLVCLLGSAALLPVRLSAQEAVADDAIQNSAQVVSAYKPINGQPHPDFVLPSIEGESTIQLSSFRGKKVLLLHFASW